MSVNARIIAATHRDLISAVHKSEFREDLFHRLAVAVLQVPALRERKGDLKLLIDHFVNELSDRVGKELNLRPKKFPLKR